eukprot:3224805-Amphidinium_carterae.1
MGNAHYRANKSPGNKFSKSVNGNYRKYLGYYRQVLCCDCGKYFCSSASAALCTLRPQQSLKQWARAKPCCGTRDERRAFCQAAG